MGMTAWGFSWKIWRKWHQRTMILRELTFFWQNMGMRALCFLENGRFFDNKWAWEEWFFSSKSEKKGILLIFFANKIVSLWQNWRSSNQIWAWQHRVFYEIFEKIEMGAPCFWENRRFFDKIWAWEQCFLENWRFFDKIWENEQ